MVNLNGITSAPHSTDSSLVILTHKCPWCGKEHSITVNSNDYIDGIAAQCDGAMMQDAFPTWTPSQREFLMTGICDNCWENM